MENNEWILIALIALVGIVSLLSTVLVGFAMRIIGTSIPQDAVEGMFQQGLRFAVGALREPIQSSKNQIDDALLKFVQERMGEPTIFDDIESKNADNPLVGMPESKPPFVADSLIAPDYEDKKNG